jgi:hypothetical protein
MKQVTLFAICIFTGLLISAQERWQADVSVTSVTISNASVLKSNIQSASKIPASVNTAAVTNTLSDLKCSITVHNENDDDANATTLVVVLPVEVSVVFMSPGGTTHTAANGSPYIAYITFDLGHMTVGQNVTVELTFTKSKYTNKVGAFAYSTSPDPNPANNYKDATF